jgi:hypothetical protein
MRVRYLMPRSRSASELKCGHSPQRWNRCWAEPPLEGQRAGPVGNIDGQPQLVRNMRDTRKIAVFAIVAAMVLGSGPAAFGKAHDQGKADGKFCPICVDPNNARDQINTLTDAGILDGHGASAVQKDGARGDIQSTLKGDGRVVPVVNNK